MGEQDNKLQKKKQKLRTNQEWDAMARSYGFANMAAVAAFLKANGLKADGKIGRDTEKALNAKGYKRSSAQTSYSSLPIGSTEDVSNILMLNDHDRNVRNAKKFNKAVQTSNSTSKQKEKTVEKEEKKENKLNYNNLVTFLTNFLRNPRLATLDGILWEADRLGLPSNIMTELRDLNVSVPYRATSIIRALYNTIVNGDTFNLNFETALANPSFYENLTTIRPLVNNENNFSEDELNEIYNMRLPDGSITNSDIKRTSPTGRYGANENIDTYFSPHKVVLTTIGQSSGIDGATVDVFDFNTKSQTAKKDNDMYLNMALENPGANYATVRAIAPFLNSIDVMPDWMKVKTIIK